MNIFKYHNGVVHQVAVVAKLGKLKIRSCSICGTSRCDAFGGGFSIFTHPYGLEGRLGNGDKMHLSAQSAIIARKEQLIKSIAFFERELKEKRSELKKVESL